MRQQGKIQMHDSAMNHGTAPRILFVDDSRLIRFAGQRFLREHFDVVLAEDGCRAWELLMRDSSIQFVITDLMMPELDGVELIRRIRQSQYERIRALPVLVVTSVEEKAGRRRALDAGATELVPKPFSGSDLIEPVRGFLRRRELQEAGGARSSGLPNIEPSRTSFVNRLEQVSSFHDRHGLEFSLLHARLDNYDRIATSFGLNWAESMMRHLERALAREVRTEDTIGRSDDAVFSMILMATPAAGAKQLRTRLRGHLARNPARFPGRSINLQLSFSIQCPGSAGTHSADAILRAGLARLDEPANVTRLTDRVTA